MYTKDNLLGFKYGELLKISKNLGIKGGRQKTEKLIQLILKEQERNNHECSLQPDLVNGEGTVAVTSDVSLLHSDNEELLENMEFPENYFSHDSSLEINDISCKKTTLSQKKVVRSKASQRNSFHRSLNFDGDATDSHVINISDMKTKITVAENNSNLVLYENAAEKCSLTSLNKNNLKEEEVKGKSLKRSRTFKLTDDEKVKRRSLRRSGTFKLKDVSSFKMPNLINGENCKRESYNIDVEENLPLEESKVVNSCEGKNPINDEHRKQSSTLSDLDCEHENDKKAHRRSGTFIISRNSLAAQNKRKRSEDSVSASDIDDILSIPVRKVRSFVVPSMGQPSPVVMDLSCNEVQTAKDIQYIEDDNSIESPFQNTNASRSRGRRSLRSHLLDSRLTVHQRLSILSGAASPAKKPVMHLQEVNEECPEAHKVEVEKLVSDNPNQSQTPGPIFTIGKDDKTCEMSQSNKIPRFVAYAKKIKSKMPDFNKIHEKAFSKMEPLDEYVERKQHTRTRSRPLTDSQSSVKKAIKESVIFNPTVTTTLDLKLNFTDIKSSNLFENKAQRKSRASISNSPLLNKRPSLSGSTRKLLKASSEDKDINSQSLKKPVTTSSKVKNMLPTKKDSKTQITPQKTKFIHPTSIPRLIKENMPPVVVFSPWNTVKKDPLLTPGSLIRRKSYNPKIVTEIEKPSYRPYKGAVRPIGHREVLKKMAEKNPKVKSRVEMRKEQKVFIKGVRTNKRFELQMAKRGIKI